MRLFGGQIEAQSKLMLMASKIELTALEIGYLEPMMKSQTQLLPGEIGYIVTNLKAMAEARVGDTLTSFVHPALKSLAGYQPTKLYIFAGLFPLDNSQYMSFKKSLAKLALSDATLNYEPENSPILGHGFVVDF